MRSGRRAASSRANALRSRTAAVGLSLLLATGCSGEERDDVAVPDGAGAESASSSPSPSASSGPTSAPSGATGAPPSATSTAEGDVFVVQGTPSIAPAEPANEAELRVATPVDGEQVAVVAAWEAFWQQLAVAYGLPEFDATAMGEVATDDALVAAETYVRELEGGGRRLTGRAVTVADAVSVDGDTAVVEGCSVGEDFEIDDRGTPMELPRGATSLRTELVREGGAWRVSGYGIVEGLC